MKLSRLNGFILLLASILLNTGIQAQDSVSVTFRYSPNESAVRAFVPGEFNNWGNNSSGRIDTDDASLMTEDTTYGFWYQTIRLEVGGGPSSYNGSSGYAYKFHEQYNSSGSSWQWFTDPLNPIAIGANSDSFVEVSSPMIFQLAGSDNNILNEESEIRATVASIDSDPVDLQNSSVIVNGEFASDLTGYYEASRQLMIIDSLNTLGLSIGENEVQINAVTQSGSEIQESLTFTYLPEIDPELSARPAGLKDGITLSENGTSATFSLFAPGKEFVFLLGDFNDWKVNNEYLMKKDSVNADSVWHWIRVDGLTPGQKYRLQYLVDGEIQIADPYSELVLDPFNDPYIPASVYPDLPNYPEEGDGYVTLIEPGKPEFNWTATGYEKPDKESMIIYELLVRDFLEDHSYESLTDSLDYLERLGVNAIELMPVNEFDGNESWGYNPSFHMALDKYYGTPEAFKTFVDEAHKRGIAVILDVVFNHATGSNPLYKMYDREENPYFNAEAKHAFNVFNDFNHQYAGTQAYVKRVSQYWIEEYKVDGFRWDLTKGFTQNCTANDSGCTGSYQRDRVAVLKKYADYQWEVDPEFVVIFEHLGTELEEAQWANYRADEGKGIMLWGNMNGAYTEAAMGYGANLFGVLSQSRDSFDKKHLVGYMESHDEQWMMLKNLKFGNSEGDYDIQNLNTALGRSKLAGAFFFTLPGPKMMWEFGEIGYGGGPDECLKPGGSGDGDCKASDPGRVSSKPIRWDYWNDPETEERRKLYKTWSALINLRFSSPAFTNPEAADYSLGGTMKMISLQHSDTDVQIIGNFGVDTNQTTVTFSQAGTWYNYFNGTELEVTDTQQVISLPPGDFVIYTTKRFEQPEEGIATSSEEENNNTGIPEDYALDQNYPNPFNPATNITYALPEAGNVSLSVYDMLGKKVATLVEGRKTAGTYSVRFDAAGLSSGVYFYRLTAGSEIVTRKMTLIK